MSTHQEYIDAIKKSAVTTGTKALLAVLLKKAPYLFIPVVGPITSLLVGKLVEILIQSTEFEVYFKYIDLRVDAQGRDFSEVALDNFQIQQTGTADEKRKIEKELIEKFKTFASLKS